MFQQITCAQARLDDAQRAPHDIARVLLACIEQSRPVYIELPRDMVNVPCHAEVVRLPPSSHDAAACDTVVETILRRLVTAVTPVLMLGVEVRRYALEDKIEALMQRFGLPVVTSFMAHGVLERCHVPPYIGAASTPEISERVEQVTTTKFGLFSYAIDGLSRRCNRAIF